MATTAENATSKPDGRSPIIVDLGKQRRKRIKDLRKGTGRLMDEVNTCLDELRTSGTVAANAQPVVIIVREKRRRRSAFLPGL